MPPLQLPRRGRIHATLGLGAERNQGGMNAAPTDAPVGVAFMRPRVRCGTRPGRHKCRPYRNTRRGRIYATLGLGAKRNQGGMNAAPTETHVGVAFMRPWVGCAERGQGGIDAAPTETPVGVAFMRPWVRCETRPGRHKCRPNGNTRRGRIYATLG